MIKNSFYLVMFFFLASTQAFGQTEETVKIQLFVNPPYTFEPESQSAPPTGFIPDLFRAIVVSGWKWEFQVKPWARAFNDLIGDTKGEVILPTLVRTPERESQVTWITPLLPLRYGFIGRLGLPQAKELNSFRDARIAVVRGNMESIWLEKQGFKKVEQVSHADQMVKMLMAGRVDYIVRDVTSFSQFSKAYGLPQDQFAVKFEIKELEQQLYIAGSLSLSPDLVSSLRNEVEKLRKSGTLEKMWLQWK